jgi:predicted aconitase
VFGAPQLSLFEIEAVAQALGGRRVHPNTTVLVTTSPEIKHAADRMGLTRRIEAAGAIVAEGICFYDTFALTNRSWNFPATDRVTFTVNALSGRRGRYHSRAGRGNRVAPAGLSDIILGLRPVRTGSAAVMAAIRQIPARMPQPRRQYC